MAITLRFQKGSKLTFSEMDENFSNLDERSSLSYTTDSGNDLQWVEGTYDFGNNIIKYANVIQAESELENYSPATYHGMTMHVHETGALYYAHAGTWRKLLSDNADGDAANAGYVDSLSAVAYDGDYNSLANTPSIPSVLTDLGINDGSNGQFLSTDGSGNFTFVDDTSGDLSLDDLTDVSVSGATSGQVLKYDGTNWLPATDLTADSGSGITLEDLSVSVQTPGSPNLTYDNTTGVFSYTPPDVGELSYTPDTNNILQWVEGTYDFGNNIIKYANVIQAESELANYSPATYHGMTMHVHETGALYYAHAGAWRKLLTDNADGDAAAAGYVDSLSAVAYDGDYNSLTNAPSIPSTLTDLNIDDGSDGQVLSTDGSGNFSFISVTSGDPDQNLFATVVSDSGSTTADTTADTLTIAGGTDIATSISGDTLTVSFTGSAGGASNFDELTDVSNAGIDVNDIFEAAIVTLRVNNDGSSAYTFNSHYSGNNPTIFALSGTTIAFDLSQIGGHPFEIRDPGGSALNSGLVHVSTTGTVSTGANAQGFDSGTLYWRIQESLSGNFSYICQFHGSMAGTITVKRLSTL